MEGTIDAQRIAMREGALLNGSVNAGDGGVPPPRASMTGLACRVILRELADRLGCVLRGDGGVEVHRVSGIEDSGPGDLTFVANPRYVPRLATTRASAVILSPDLQTPLPSLVSPNPYLAYARAAGILHPPVRPAPGVDPAAHVHPTARLGADVHVGPLAVIGRAASASAPAAWSTPTPCSTPTSRSARTACSTPACTSARPAAWATA